MHTRQLLRCLLMAFICTISTPLYASHLAGGQMSYQYLGDTMVSGMLIRRYEATLVLYQDCYNGQAEAVAQDNPAYFSVFDGAGNYVAVDTNIYYSSTNLVPPVIGICGPSYLPGKCMKRTVFKRTYLLPANTTGYVIAYQRCCRNSNIVNLQVPSDRGLTYYCTIPANINNSSAQFVNDMPQLMCLGNTFIFDHSAMDVDGDSLTYSLCAAISGASEADIKPISKPGPYQPLTYVPPYTATSPLPSEPAIRLDSVTGMMYCTPTKVGLFQLAVCVNEWRSGVLINTAVREFQIEVSDCVYGHPGGAFYKPDAGGDKVILRGEQVHFDASGGNTYEWTPASYLSDPNTANPVGIFPETGTYAYVLRTVSDSGCVGRDTVIIRVIDHSEFLLPTAFSPNGDNINDVLKPIPVKDATLIRFRVFDRKGVTVYGGGIVAPKGWDGTYQGVPQDVGVYFWELHYKDNSGVYRVSKGEVTLIR